MSRRAMFPDPPPKNAHVYKNVKWITITKKMPIGKDLFCVKYWIGKAQKPTQYYAFSTTKLRSEFIERLKEIEDEKEVLKQKRKEEKVKNKAAMLERIQVGTILCYSWGWEQTNCDFFQVVSKKESKIQMRPIGHKLLENSGGSSMSGYAVPIPNEFIGDEVITKIVNAYGVSMGHGIASPTEPGEKHYVSWYA